MDKASFHKFPKTDELLLIIPDYDSLFLKELLIDKCTPLIIYFALSVKVCLQ